VRKGKWESNTLLRGPLSAPAMSTWGRRGSCRRVISGNQTPPAGILALPPTTRMVRVLRVPHPRIVGHRPEGEPRLRFKPYGATTPNTPGSH